MQKLFLLFLLSSFNLIGQIEILNNSLIDPHEKILYCATNRLEVIGLEMDSTFLVLRNADTLIHYENEFNYYCYSSRKYDTITISKNDSILHRAIFQVKMLPRPSIYLGVVRDTFVARSYLLSNPGLILTYDSTSYIPCSNIQNFEAVIVNKKGKEKELKNIFLYEKRWSDEEIDKTIKKLKQSYPQEEYISYSEMNKFSKSQLRQIK